MADGAAAARGRDLRVIGLVGSAHGVSHFFQLVLPSIFLFLIDDLGVGYTGFGFLMSFFYAASGLAQTPAGFAVDRFGARTVLSFGIFLFASAFLLIALVHSYWLMVPLVVVAGIGNSVFHPADYAILTSAVRKDWLARAYGIHQLGGNLGWALAPTVTVTLAALFGWHTALVVLGLLGYVLLGLILWQGAALGIGGARAATVRAGAPRGAPLQLLMAPAILLCFSYFICLAIATSGFQQFLPAALSAAHATPLRAAAMALTAYLLGGAVGIMVGGWLADRSDRHERILGIGLFAAALLTLLVGILDLPVAALLGIVAAAGFCSGATSPSRDMMVRGATPPGATGKVFGFVYSGLDLGSALIPPVLGFLIDHRVPIGFFAVIAAALLACILVALLLQRGAAERDAALALKPAE